jgi:two-component system LytT family sensor kinase
LINLASQRLRTLISTVYSNRMYQYWLMQVIGWGGLCVITLVCMILWFNSVQWSYIAHVILQSMLGLVLSLPLHQVYLALGSRPIRLRAIISLLAVMTVSLLWTLLSIFAFISITNEQRAWAGFDGWYFSSLLVYMSWTALYYGNKYYYEAQLENTKKRSEAIAIAREEQLKRLSAEADSKNAQLVMLRYQLNPHFLFNTLNNISALVKFQENEKAHRMITQLGYFLRYSLDNDPALKISLDQEIEALMLYLEIEQTRFGERLNLEFNIDEQARHAQVPSLLLQPLAENSIKYAIAANENGGTIKLEAAVREGELQIELTDTGPGTMSNKPAPRTGRRVGLHNTLERLKTLYNDTYMFDIKLRPSGGLKISIRIPYDPAH